MAGAEGSLPRILCIMGSGETAPTMVSVHADLMSRLGPPPVPAVLLDTPFGFQENADDIAQRAVLYFEHNVGYPIAVATFRNRDAASQLEYETLRARIASARYVFAGPGSPTYALHQWRDTAVPDLLRDKLRSGGCVTFASAAACGLGACALPVYEVYKVGEPPRWNEGLDVLGAFGLHVAVIPHYNNAEGGTHDTRYCYMGERRLRLLEDMLSDDTDILGVDEHTACIFDLDAATVTVRGRGVVTWRHRGMSRTFEAGSVTPIAALASSGDAQPAPQPMGRGEASGEDVGRSDATPFMVAVETQSLLADQALKQRDVDGAVTAMLALDTEMHDWAADTLSSDEPDRARAALRQLMVRLADLARSGAADPRDQVAPIVDRLLALRERVRGEGQYALADQLRDVLVDAGVEVRDTREGSSWDLGVSAKA